MSALRVPLALDQTGRLTAPKDAARGASYSCPACGRAVVAKRGRYRVHHFAHAADTNCSIETIEHKAAKLLIVQAIVDSKVGRGPRPVLVRTCPTCGRDHRQPIPDGVVDAREEYVLENGLRVDVALMGNDAPRVAVEICATHPVDAAKAEAIGILWFELTASDVLNNPYEWRPVQYRLKPFACLGCRERAEARRARIKQHRERCDELASKLGIGLPNAPYICAPHFCYGCGTPMLVFAWPGSAHGLEIFPPPARGRPRSLVLCTSRTKQKRGWLNVCLFCERVQGNYYLHRRPGGPFVGLLEFWNSARHLDQLDRSAVNCIELQR